MKTKKTLRKGLAAVMSMALVLAMMLTVAPVTNVQAAEKSVVATEEAEKDAVLKSVFSAKYYADCNPDVKAIYGYDEEALFKHFKDHGLEEGRVVSPILDVKAYREGNPDLNELFGDDWLGYINHFVKLGIKESAEGKRPASGILFNPVVFMEQNPDLDLSIDGDLMKVVEYYIENDMPAGDWADPVVVAVYEEPQTLAGPRVEENASASEVSAPEDVGTVESSGSDESGNSSSDQTGSEPSTPVVPVVPDVPEEPDEPACTGDHSGFTFC